MGACVSNDLPVDAVDREKKANTAAAQPKESKSLQVKGKEELAGVIPSETQHPTQTGTPGSLPGALTLEPLTPIPNEQQKEKKVEEEKTSEGNAAGASEVAEQLLGRQSSIAAQPAAATTTAAPPLAQAVNPALALARRDSRASPSPSYTRSPSVSVVGTDHAAAAAAATAAAALGETPIQKHRHSRANSVSRGGGSDSRPISALHRPGSSHAAHAAAVALASTAGLNSAGQVEAASGPPQHVRGRSMSVSANSSPAPRGRSMSVSHVVMPGVGDQSGPDMSGSPQQQHAPRSRGHSRAGSISESPAQRAGKLGLAHSNSNSELKQRDRARDKPLAQQVLKRNLHDSPQTGGRTLGTGSAPQQQQGDPANGGSSFMGNGETPLLGSRPATPSGTDALQTKVGAIWEHYAGRDAKVLYKRSLLALSEDVLDEFQTRYRLKLKQINHGRKSEPYTDAMIERDLMTDLPYLLPAQVSNGAGGSTASSSSKQPTRDDYVKYIYKRCITEMMKYSAGKSISGSGIEPGADRSGPHAPKLTKFEFLAGWRHCSDLLFAAIEQMKDPDQAKGAGPCHLM